MLNNAHCSLTDLLDVKCRRNAVNSQTPDFSIFFGKAKSTKSTILTEVLYLDQLLVIREIRILSRPFSVKGSPFHRCFSVCMPLLFSFFRAKKVRAVRQEKTGECHVTERLSLATPLTSVNWTPPEQFATILPRMLYNSAMAALGCQWLLLVKVTWLITQAVTVWIFLILVSCEWNNI